VKQGAKGSSLAIRHLDENRIHFVAELVLLRSLGIIVKRSDGLTPLWSVFKQIFADHWGVLCAD
jgi:hypothetical protein